MILLANGYGKISDLGYTVCSAKLLLLKLVTRGEVIHLREYHTFGRRRHEVDTLLDYAFVSKLHTVIEWKAESWVITDMSSNGTWVNGDRLSVYTPRLLKKGDLIEITGSGNLKFDVVNISAPVDMVYRVDDKLEMRLLDENQLLPNESLPILEVYKCPERLNWFALTMIGRPNLVRSTTVANCAVVIICGSFLLLIKSLQRLRLSQHSKFFRSRASFRCKSRRRKYIVNPDTQWP